MSTTATPITADLHPRDDEPDAEAEGRFEQHVAEAEANWERQRQAAKDHFVSPYADGVADSELDDTPEPPSPTDPADYDGDGVPAFLLVSSEGWTPRRRRKLR